MKSIYLPIVILALCVVGSWLFPSFSEAVCPVKAEKANKSQEVAKKQEMKLKQMLQAMGGSSENDQVILKDPGTVTTIATGKGLTDPRSWTPKEQARFAPAKVNSSLPAPKGVWK